MNVIGSLFILIGSLFCFLGALGLLRMPDVYNRIQTGTKAVTLGVLATLLGVELPYDPKLTTLHVSLPANFYSAGGHPQLLAYLACFGTLFLLVRWWRQADPLRRTRISLWALFCSAVAAMLVAMLWQFPQPWPIMVSAIISVSVQLASPWVPLRDRPVRNRW